MKMRIDRLIKGQKLIFAIMEETCAFMKQSINANAAAFDLEAREEDLIAQVDIERFMGLMNFFLNL